MKKPKKAPALSEYAVERIMALEDRVFDLEQQLAEARQIHFEHLQIITGYRQLIDEHGIWFDED